MYPSEAEPKSQSKILRSKHTGGEKLHYAGFEPSIRSNITWKLTLTKHTTDAQHIKAKLIYSINFTKHLTKSDGKHSR